MAKRMPGDVRREQIAEAALALAASGLKAVTLAKVARLVGVVPSALYRHFRNKDAIVEALLDLLHQRLVNIVEQARAETSNALEAMQRVMVLHARLATEQRGVPRVLFSDEVVSDPDEKGLRVRALQLDMLGRLAALAAEGRAQGVIRQDMADEDVAFLLFGLTIPTALLHYLSGGRMDILERVAANQRLFALFVGVAGGGGK